MNSEISMAAGHLSKHVEKMLSAAFLTDSASSTFCLKGPRSITLSSLSWASYAKGRDV